ncbi:MAG: tetratricopeptide repeat protein [Planctomycetota bacterium]
MSLADVERLLLEIERRGATLPASGRLRESCIAGLRTGLETGLVQNPMLSRWERHQITAFTPLEDGTEVIVAVRIWDKDGITTQSRWWLRRGGDVWRVYDVQDLLLNLRWSDVMILMLETVGPRGTPPEWAGDVKRLPEALMLILSEQWQEAERMLGAMSPEPPGPFGATHSFLFAALRLRLGKPEEALSGLERAEKLHSKMPGIHLLRSSALNELGRHEQALQCARKYLALLGSDADGYFQVGQALMGLDRTEEAIEAFREGLADDPEMSDNLVGLGFALPPGGKEEIVERFQRLRNPRESFEGIAVGLLDAGDADALALLADGLREIAPQDPNAAYYGARAAMLAKRWQHAVELLRPAIPGVTSEEERPAFFDAYLQAMIAADKALEAYEGPVDPMYSFEYLADHFVEQGEMGKSAELVEAHRVAHAGDPWIPYYEGELLLAESRYSEAATAYRRGLVRAGDDQRTYHRKRSVYCHFLAGEGLRAYREVGPQEGIFDQLGWLCSERDDAELLATLVETHRER